MVIRAVPGTTCVMGGLVASSSSILEYSELAHVHFISPFLLNTRK